MPGCVRMQTKKYRVRSSPPYHAGDCKGKTIKGNDGRRYKSVADACGVYKWVSISRIRNKTRKDMKAPGTCYEIHDNYNRPFIVCIESGKKKLTVYKAIADNPGAQKPKYGPGEVVYTKHYRGVFIGDNVNGLKDYVKKGTAFSKGNSVLAELMEGHYVFVGEEIYEFHVVAGDVIEAYHSPIGNNDVPYPVAVGKEYLYFLLMGDHVYVPRALFDMKGDLYRQFYDMTLDAASGGKEAIVKPKKFAVKMIRKRWAKKNTI
jgi:hypothetical protein